MNQDSQFTAKLQAWVNTPDPQKDWDEGALMLLQLSGNRIMYHNISINPKGKAEFIKGQLQKYLNFRLQKLTRDQVCQMQSEVDEIVKKVIKPTTTPDASPSEKSVKSEEFADFKAGKRPDHDDLPEEIQALYVENLDIVHRMRELHLKLRSLSLENATCPDSERYPFLKEGDTLTEAYILTLPEDQQEQCNQLNRRTEFTVLRTTYGLFDKEGKLIRTTKN